MQQVGEQPHDGGLNGADGDVGEHQHGGELGRRKIEINYKPFHVKLARYKLIVSRFGPY